ncbi:MAG: methyl-accepting chemotaxis protein [Beijerinckiaceae bacterium]|nr:methyl-accepting chemotaxis protein [Beijerinckiaceae bacterium]
MAFAKNLPIAGKFILLIAIFGAMYISSIVYATSVMRTIDEGYNAAARHQGKAANDLEAAGRFFNGVRAAIGDILISTTDAGNQAAMDEIKESRAQFITFTTNAAAADPSIAEQIGALKVRGLAVIDVTCDQSIKLGLAATAPADIMASQAEYLKSCSPAFVPLIKDVKALSIAAEASQAAIQETLSRSTNATIWISFIAALVGLAAVSAGAYFCITSWVSNPVKNLAVTMKALAAGNFQVAVDNTDRQDEIGPMAAAVQVFKDNGLKLRAAEAEAAGQRQAAEQERAANEAIRAEIQRQQALVVSSVASGLERLAKGDLTNRLTQAFTGEYEKLRADFNATANSLQDALRTIASATDGISSGSDQIALASDDLSRRTEQQAANLEETAAALNLITDTVKSMAAGATEAAKIVASTRNAAESSGGVVQQAVGAMSKIKESSREIGNIIGVIDEIAFQTNLLALNAGVEAARAGEAGRGFAVVASEVRALAQRSAEAAKQIKTLISTSTNQVESGVLLVDRTGAALTDIIEKVSEMDALVRKISASSQEQAAGLAEINTAMNQMDQVVQQNAAMVEESTAAAHALKGETANLTGMVGRFQIGGPSRGW